MRSKELLLQKQTSPPSVLTKDERYELIAQAAIKIEDCQIDPCSLCLIN